MANNETTTKFKVDISELKKAMQEAKRQISIANSEFKAVSSSMDNWSKSTEGLQAKLKQLDSNLNSQKTILKNLEKQYEAVVAEQGSGSAAADRLKVAINNQKASINNTEKQIKTYGEALKTAEKAEEIAAKTGRDAAEVFDELADNAREAGDSAEKSSDGFTVMKGALANLVADGIRLAIDALKDLAKQSVTTGMDFEKSMDEVAAISGATGKDLELLEKTAKEYGATTTFSASEAAQALKYMALAGWDAETASNALGGVLDLAAASGMDLAQASDMVTDYLSAFGLEASKSTYFADMLAYAQSNSNTSAEQLGEAYKNSAASMKAAGQDVETTTALLAQMANQGFKGSEAGTALTAMMRDMTAKMKDGKIAIGNTKVAVQDANGNYRDMTDILKDVEKATQGMGDAERATALSATFTADSTKGLNLLLNAGVGEAEKFEEALRGAGGTAGEMGDIMNDNAQGDIKQMQSALEDVMLVIYDELKPYIREFIQDITTKVIPNVKKLIQNAKDFIKGLEDAEPVIVGVGVALAGLALTALIGNFSKVIALIKSWTVVTKLQAAAQAALNIAMNMNPIGIVIALIAGLVAAFVVLWNKSEAFRNFWIGLWENIQKTAATVIKSVSGFFSGMWDGFKSGAAKAWEGIKSVFSSVATFFKDTFTKAWTAVKNVFSVGGKIFDGIKDGIVSAFKTIVNAIIKGINKVVSIPFDGINWALNKIKSVNILGAKPFDWIQTIGVPQIPLLRKGGILKRGQMGLLEGDGAEAVVPLERNTEWINNIAKGLADNLRGGSVGATGSGIGGVVNNFYQTNNSPKALSRLEIYRQSKNLLGYAGGIN